MKFTPIQNKVIFKMIEKDKSTESGIILFSGDPNAPTQGEIVAVADGIDSVKIGDKVLVDWNKATKTVVDDQTFFIVKEEAIIAVFE